MLVTIDLTNSERLYLQRRRDGDSQPEAAIEWGCSEWTYRMYEIGVLDIGVKINIGEAKPNELCIIMRRRLGIKRKDLAKKVGVSGWWLTQMEQGIVPFEKLVEYWRTL